MSKEELFRRALGEALKEKLFIQEEKKEGKYGIHIENGRNLLYKVILDGNLEYRPKNPDNPKRGSLAFQTDLLITYRKNKRNIPIVAIETKFDSLSTHDILTYSAKAQKHKEIYPYLRYGLVIGKKGNIPNRFFIHNTGFDFAYALEVIEDPTKPNSQQLDNLARIINKQINNALLLLDILLNRKRMKYFSSYIEGL